MGFTRIARKKQQNLKKPPALLEHRYSRAEQKVIVLLRQPPPTSLSALACWERAEAVLKATRKEARLRFSRAYFTRNQNLVLETSLSSRGRDFEPFFEALCDAFPELDIANISSEARWSKFLLHGVPTNVSMAQLADSLDYHYPELRLAQTPRWLSTAAQRSAKSASTAVIALLGTHSRASIGLTKLTVVNTVCKLGDFSVVAPPARSPPPPPPPLDEPMDISAA
jgi:hypothetical protein